MHWIATAALVVIAGCAVSVMYNFGVFVEYMTGPRTSNVNTHIIMNPQIVDLLSNFTRRRKTKKEAV